MANLGSRTRLVLSTFCVEQLGIFGAYNWLALGLSKSKSMSANALEYARLQLVPLTTYPEKDINTHLRRTLPAAELRKTRTKMELDFHAMGVWSWRLDGYLISEEGSHFWTLH